MKTLKKIIGCLILIALFASINYIWVQMYGMKEVIEAYLVLGAGAALFMLGIGLIADID